MTLIDFIDYQIFVAIPKDGFGTIVHFKRDMEDREEEYRSVNELFMSLQKMTDNDIWYDKINMVFRNKYIEDSL